LPLLNPLCVDYPLDVLSGSAMQSFHLSKASPISANLQP
jgi:hypothetical protein